MKKGLAECPRCGAPVRAEEAAADAGPVADTSPLTSIFPPSEPALPPSGGEDGKPRRRRVLGWVLLALLLAAAGGYACLHFSTRASEEEAWLSVRDSASIPALAAFLCDYPDGNYFEQADSLLRALRAADDGAWARVALSADAEDFRNYLVQHPEGLHAHAAEQKIDSLDWERAVLENTEEAYAAYLQAHPDGSYAADAQAMGQALEALKLSAEEEAQVELTMEAYCRAVQNNDENALLSFFPEVIGQYFEIRNATKDDVLGKQRALYNGNILNLTVAVGDDLVASRDESGDFHTAFSAEVSYVHADSGKEDRTSLIIRAVLSPDLKIKILTAEETTPDEAEGEGKAAVH